MIYSRTLRTQYILEPGILLWDTTTNSPIYIYLIPFSVSLRSLTIYKLTIWLNTCPSHITAFHKEVDFEILVLEIATQKIAAM